jgi:hypothetical protein
MVLLAMLGIASFGFIALAGADTTIEGTWVRMRGIVTEYGDDRAFGWICAHAAMINKNGTYHEWARVHATWCTPEYSPTLESTRPPVANKTFTVYAARLKKTTDVTLADGIFTVSGLWNVVKITITITVYPADTVQLTNIGKHCVIEPVVTNATGELRVSTNNMRWSLGIEGIDLLRGTVRVIVIRHWEIKIADVNDDNKVDIEDLVIVAKRYRLVPGLNYADVAYDHNYDLNFNDEIDMGDITTVAANMGA